MSSIQIKQKRSSLSNFFVFALFFRYLFSMIQVSVGIVIRGGKVLLCQRKQSARYGLKWEFPGGKTEAGENSGDCLKRELFEELGIQAVVGDLFHRQQFIYADGGTFDIAYHIIPDFKGALVNRVFESYLWVPVVQVQQYDLLEGNRDVAGKLVSEYGSVAQEKD
jgi:8-oxo-dGTP diphosphatase